MVMGSFLLEAADNSAVVGVVVVAVGTSLVVVVSGSLGVVEVVGEVVEVKVVVVIAVVVVVFRTTVVAETVGGVLSVVTCIVDGTMMVEAVVDIAGEVVDIDPTAAMVIEGTSEVVTVVGISCIGVSDEQLCRSARKPGA